MASNRFGTLFTLTTWGESHGKAIGVVIDGCPAGLPISEEEIAQELAKRRPGISEHTSQRKEPDHPQILSGLFNGLTTGAPISILIPNKDVQSTHYEQNKHLLRPGHANFTYEKKYGIFDHRGGGRASARETACRVAAGAIAKKLLAHYDIQTLAYLDSIGEISSFSDQKTLSSIRSQLSKSAFFWPSSSTESAATALLEKTEQAGDSVGGKISFLAENLPVGLGDPVYEKLEAKLGAAMLSIPASKAFSIGSGFSSSLAHGSSHNDTFTCNEEKISTHTNHAGGTLGGISTGMPLYGEVCFKPTSSIAQPQATVDLNGNPDTLESFPGKRHDPCLAIRAVPVVEAMLNLVLADSLLLNRAARL